MKEFGINLTSAKLYNKHKMQLSTLQKYILKQTLADPKNKVSRDIFDIFYNQTKPAPAKEIRANIITKSIERLIDKGLLIGFGEKTQFKLFIKQVKLTAQGKKIAQSLLGQQTTFPFIKKKK